MATYKRKQGDSLWIDITCNAAYLIDSLIENWTGVWALSTAIGSPVVLEGDLARAANWIVPVMPDGETTPTENGGATAVVFQLRIGPKNTVGWADLTLGTYMLTLQIDDDAVDYRHEETHKVIVQTQGKMDA